MSEPVTEYGVRMPDGGFLIRNSDPEAEQIYPVAQWAASEIRARGHVCRRRIIVVEDWEELTGMMRERGAGVDAGEALRDAGSSPAVPTSDEYPVHIPGTAWQQDGPGLFSQAGYREEDLLYAPEHAHELNPPPDAWPVLDGLCRGGNHEACVGPPGTRCECRCHVGDLQEEGCSCPSADGKTYHQRTTCTDPVVARLDWYADGPGTP